MVIEGLGSFAAAQQNCDPDFSATYQAGDLSACLLPSMGPASIRDVQAATRTFTRVANSLDGQGHPLHFEKGECMFTLRDGQKQSAPYDVRIYHDALWTQPSRCNLSNIVTAASMQLTGPSKGQPVVLPFATGSDVCFLREDVCAASMQLTGPVMDQSVVLRFDTVPDACFVGEDVCRALKLPTKSLMQPLNVSICNVTPYERTNERHAR